MAGLSQPKLSTLKVSILDKYFDHLSSCRDGDRCGGCKLQSWCPRALPGKNPPPRSHIWLLARFISLWGVGLKASVFSPPRVFGTLVSPWDGPRLSQGSAQQIKTQAAGSKSKPRVPIFQGLISKRTSLIPAMFYSLESKSLGPAHTRGSSQEGVRCAYHILEHL